MLIALLALLVCASMFAIYAIVRTEERHLPQRRADVPPSLHDSNKDGFRTGLSRLK